jgi:hypothetical protein
MVTVDVEDMLADCACGHLVKLCQQPLVKPDCAILQPDLNAGFSVFGLVEYDICGARCNPIEEVLILSL